MTRITSTVLSLLVVGLALSGQVLAQEAFPLSERGEDGQFSSDRPWSEKPLADQADFEAWVDESMAPRLGLNEEDALVRVPSSKAPGGISVIRLQQEHQGLPVIGLDSVVMLDQDGYPVLVHGKHLGLADLPIEPLITLEQAFELAALQPNSDVAPRLVYWARSAEIKLAWHLTGFASAERFRPAEVYVDALSGEVLEQIALTHQAMQRKVIDVAQACNRRGITRPVAHDDMIDTLNFALNNGLARREGQASFGSAAADRMYSELGASYTFMASVFDMDSIDNDGRELFGIADVRFHPASDDFQCVGNEFNAAWYGQYNFLAVPESIMHLTEVFGHEFAHGIVTNGSDLAYSGASGALNESLADMIGVAYRAWRESGGAEGMEVTDWRSDSAFWQLRQDTGLLRDMQQPRRIDPRFPDHYADYDPRLMVHVGSGVMNHAFFLMAEGGQHRRLGRGPRVEQPLGLQNTARIAAYSAAYTLTPNSDFAMARVAMAYSASILFGEGSPEWQSVHQAFDAIGVPGRWQPVPPRPPIAPPAAPAPPVATAPEIAIPPVVEPHSPQNPSGDPASSPAGMPVSIWIALLALLLAGGLMLLFFGRPKVAIIAPDAALQSDSDPLMAPRQPHQKAGTDSRHAFNFSLQPIDGSEPIQLYNPWMQSREGMILGRAQALCHVCMESREVSRRHLRIRLSRGQVFCEDLNSSNGSAINGRPLKPFEATSLQLGQQLQIAGFTYQLTDGK